MPLVCSLAAQDQTSDAIILHLGENDLGRCKRKLRAKKDLRQIQELFPDVTIVWSDMLQYRGRMVGFHPKRCELSNTCHTYEGLQGGVNYCFPWSRGRMVGIVGAVA